MSSRWHEFVHKEGLTSKQAHADFPHEGIYEREIGAEGFFGPATHMHHKHPPTAWSSFEGPLRPRLFDALAIKANTSSPFLAPLLLSNKHCRYRIWQCSHNMPRLARNADGDELLFVHEGLADLLCDFGHLSIKEGDYVLLPRSTSWRLEIKSPITLLMIEATGEHYRLPEKGIMGNHAIFDPAAIDVPAINDIFKAQQDENPWEIETWHHQQVSIQRYPFNPLDAVGWHGNWSVLRINWRDIRPLMSHRYHVPPSAHTTFVSPRFVVCTFVPRPIESDPGALKVPFFHSNVDFDEVLFYHQGDFFSRDNIRAGMVSFHPYGFSHGPHPKAFEAGMAGRKKETNEVAVMLDTRDALILSEAAQAAENPHYVKSWQI